MKPNRIIVAGGRDFSDIELMEEKLNHLLQKRSLEDTAIISGMANGADTLGTHWAEEHGFEVMRFPADWTMYGRSAGYRRNHEMLKNATGLIAFWDGKSKGTAHMIKIAHEANIKVAIIQY
jgi:hypothetical protein